MRVNNLIEGQGLRAKRPRHPPRAQWPRRFRPKAARLFHIERANTEGTTKRTLISRSRLQSERNRCIISNLPICWLHMEMSWTLIGAARRRPLKVLYFVVSLGVSFGFVASVITIAHATWFHLPPGVADRAYVTALRATAVGVRPMSVRDFEGIAASVSELEWFYVQPTPAGPLRAMLSSGETLTLDAHLVSAGFFEALGVQTALGVQAAPGDEPGIVISDATWRRSFARADIVGSMLRFEEGPAMRIIGVTAPAFVGVMPLPADAWVLNAPPGLGAPQAGPGFSPEAQRKLANAMSNVTVFGVVPDGKTRERVLLDVGARLSEYRFDSSPVIVDMQGTPSANGASGVPQRRMFKFGVTDSDRVTLGPGLETSPDMRREVVRRMSWLVGIVAMLLFLAFATALEYLMADSVAREDEQDVRIAIGATPLDLFRQALAENLIVAAVMGLMMWLTAGYVTDVLMGIEPFSSYLGGQPVAKGFGIAVAGVLLTLAFLICLAYATWVVVRRSASLSGSGRVLRRWSQRILLFVGTASLVAVLSLAGRYLTEARLSLGFENTDVAYVVAVEPQRRLDQTPVTHLVDVIEAIPGVRSAATARLKPLAASWQLHHFKREVIDRPEFAPVQLFENSVSPSFFRTLGVEVLAGRTFESDAYGETVVSHSAAEALGGVQSILGTLLRIKGPVEWEAMIVGVVGDVPYGDNGVAETRVVYRAIPALSMPQKWLVHADSSLDVIDAFSQLPQYASWEITLDGSPAATFREQFIARRSVEIVLSVAAAFTLVLALAGVANSLARTVAESRTQVGIRIALGATPVELVRAFLSASCLDLAFASVVVGALGLTAKAAAPAFAEALELWFVLPAILGLLTLIGLVIHARIWRLYRREAVAELIHRAVTRGTSGGA